MADRHVVPDDNEWSVKAPNAERASSKHETQSEAEKVAKNIVNNAGGGEAVVHGEDGEIRKKDTIGKKDPFPPAG